MELSSDAGELLGKGFARPVGFGKRPALLVVDFISGFTDPDSALGSEVGSEIAQTNRLIQAARAQGLRIYFSTIRYDEANCADAGLWLTKIGGLSALSSGSEASKPDSRLLIAPADPIIVKKFASCFFRTDLLTQICRDGVDTLVLAGCTTSGCVRATAVDACQHGIRAIVARDAVADRMEIAHRQSLIDIELKYGDVLSVDQILRAFGAIAKPNPGKLDRTKPDATDSSQSASGPLSGVRVVEIGTLVAAPFASRILAEFGADVIKIESRGGDPLRRWRELRAGTSLWWTVQSRNKKSITLDLKEPLGREIARKLIGESDILIENLRPGALERLGLGWDALHAVNSRLVMVRISGFGQDGPMRDRPGFGAIGEAMGGLRYTTGEPDGAPSRVGISIGDSLAGMQGVIGALMSLLHVRNGGQGQIVDVSLFESVFAMMESIITEYADRGHIRERSGGRLPGISPSNTYRSRDGFWVVIAGNSDAIFRRLMEAIARPDLANDPMLQSNDGRVMRDELIDTAISNWAGIHDVTDILTTLDRADVPSSRIYNARDIMNDSQYRARDMILTETLADGGSVAMPGIVPKLSATPGKVRWVGPMLGEHTDEVLACLGYSAAQIADLRMNGVI